MIFPDLSDSNHEINLRDDKFKYKFQENKKERFDSKKILASNDKKKTNDKRA